MRTKINLSAIKPFPVAFASYLALAVGGLGLGDEFSIAGLIFGVGFLAISADILLRTKKIDANVFAFVFLAALYLIPQIIQTNDVKSSLQKIDGFLIGGLMVFLISRYGYTKYQSEFLKSMALAGALILVLTIAYKINFGFWDRNVRFFLNGPILFGWMMSVVGLISLSVYTAQKKLFYLFLIPFFLISIIWTGSKGPLIAFFVSAVFFLFLEKKIGVLLLFLVISLAALAVVIEYGLMPERFFVINRIMSNQLLDSDFGSVGSRQLMISESLDIFYDYPIFGVGIANWPSFLSDRRLPYYGFIYPHNIFAELFSEYGVFGFSIFLFLLVYIYRSSDNLGKSLLSLSLILLLFTGHMAYWRFLIFFPMVFSKDEKLKWTT